jgi:hypothetical protein
MCCFFRVKAKQVATECVVSLTQGGSFECAGPALHGAGAVRVACGQGLGHGGCGLVAGVACPAQSELQRGSLRERLERWQPLWEQSRKHCLSTIIHTFRCGVSYSIVVVPNPGAGELLVGQAVVSALHNNTGFN